MKHLKYLFIIIFILFISGCDSKKSSDKFYSDYNEYNGNSKYVWVDLDNSSLYNFDVDIENVFKENAIIFIGKSNDNKSRVVVNVMNKIISNSNVETIYYYDNLAVVKDYVSGDIDIPVVLFVIDGKVESYVTNDKEELSEDEELELYGKYLDGVHKVLGDVCDEEC